MGEMIKKLALTLIFGSLLQATVCFGQDKLQVLSSIQPVQLLVQAIGGEHVESSVLTPATVSPHDFALKPSLVRRLESAGLIFWIGPEMEAYLAKIMSNKTISPKAVALGELSVGAKAENDHQLLAGRHYHHGAHYWLNPLQGLRMGRQIAEALGERDPANSDSYNAALTRFEASLLALDEQMSLQLGPLSDRGFIVLHDAYGHFVEHYGLKQQGAYALTPDAKPGLRHVVSMREAIASGQVVCVFQEPQADHTVLERLVGDYPVRIGLLDPLAMDSGGGEDAYAHYLHNFGQAVADCLSP
jgi:zinc transport system substrate-binding protein